MKEWVSGLNRDLRFAVRVLVKRPALTAVAAFTLALGIGAATTVFSMVDAVLLRPLPYKDPSRLAAVWVASTREKGLAKVFATYADYLEFRRSARTLQSVGAATWATQTGRVLTGYGTARQVLTIPATVSFFETLGVPAALGRTFRLEDENRGCSILVAHNFWTSALGGSRSILGKAVTLDDKPCTVVGVMPDGFSFYPGQTQAWILLGPGVKKDQDQLLVGIFARLKPGITLTQAETELSSLFRAIHSDSRTRDFHPAVYDLHGEFTFLAGRTLRTTLILVFAAVLLLLFIACLTVANFLLVRLSERRRELAVRAALGSNRSRLIRQVLAEGLVLSGGSAILGVALASAAIRYFRIASPIELSVGATVAINWSVLAFSIALSVGTTLIFALLPALRASQVDLIQALKAGGRGSVQGRHGLMKAVITVEMALSFTLLIGAGLLMESALRMGSEPLGFKPDHVLTARIFLPVSRYSTNSQRLRLFDALLDSLERLPDVAGVTLASKVPPDAGGNQVLEIQGRPVAAGAEIHDIGADAVSPRFFEVLNIPLRTGRAFTALDRDNSQPVAIVNEALAEKHFHNMDPLGQRIRIPGRQMPWLTVVGVVANVKHSQLMNEMSWVETPILYRPLAQEPRQSVQLAVRALRNSGSLVPEAHRKITDIDPSVPVTDSELLNSRLSRTLAYPRFRAAVFAFFSLAALILSTVGLHGVLSQVVAQRTPEFGVRRAVGAQTYHLLLLIARQGGTPVLAGLAAGVCFTIASSRVLANLLYGIQPTDPKAFALVSLLLLMVAAVAILLPAARAARVDPLAALHDE